MRYRAFLTFPGELIFAVNADLQTAQHFECVKTSTAAAVESNKTPSPDIEFFRVARG